MPQNSRHAQPRPLFRSDARGARHRPPPLRARRAPAAGLPARPRRPAHAGRGHAVSGPGAAAGDPRSLRDADALLAGRRARAARRAVARRHAGRAPTRARSGSSSPTTSTCSAARRAAAGWSTSWPTCSASRAAHRRRPRGDLRPHRAEAATPAFRPRALFERFNIEVLCTTDAATDPLTWHQQIRASGWGAGPADVPARPRDQPPASRRGPTEIARLGKLSAQEIDRSVRAATSRRSSTAGRSSSRWARPPPITPR